MGELHEYFLSNKGRQIHKFHHYFEIYERHLQKFRNKPVRILEIGVFQGGSLQMWKDYFGPATEVYGLDIDPRCKELEEDQINIIIGSQSDRKFLRSVRKDHPPFDIIIDDGGHTMSQQIITFEELYEHVTDDGIYICEDLHTSYFLLYGGGHRRAGTFIEYSKKLVDKINAWFAEQRSLKEGDITRSTHSLHFYPSMLVIEKRNMEKPSSDRIGTMSFESPYVPKPLWRRALAKARIIGLKALNRILRTLRIRGIILR